jgi:hypothetical protein
MLINPSAWPYIEIRMQDEDTVMFLGNGGRVQVLGKTLINQNYIQEEIRSIEVRECLLSFGEESLSFSLLQKNLKIKVNRNIILPVVV